MRTLEEIKIEIERASARRAELWQRLGEGRDPVAAAELKQVEEELGRLWDEQRQTRARIRFGDRDKIVARARAEERLLRAA